jgi:hypothetical protein
MRGESLHRAVWRFLPGCIGRRFASENYIMPKVNPTHVFVHAEQFRAAAKFLATAPQVGFPFDVGLPIPVCSSFALELYFKCLIAMSGRGVPQWHDLKDLFDKLEPNIKAKIRAHTEPYLVDTKAYIVEEHRKGGKPAPTVDFNFILRASRGAFELARYVYETGLPAGKGWIADAIVEGTRKTILEINPNWERMRSSMKVVTRKQPT